MSTPHQVALKIKGLRLTPAITRSLLEVAGWAIENEAKERAPWDTGELRRDIHTEVEVNGTSGGVAYIGNSDAIPYAIYQELGTRHMAARAYLRGGLHAGAPEAAKQVMIGVRAFLKLQARR